MFLLITMFSLFSQTPEPYLPVVEPLIGVSIDKDALQITIAQCGGTGKASFRIEIRKEGSEQYLTVYRIQEDRCKMLPQEEVILFPHQETGLDIRHPVHLQNPLVVGALNANLILHERERQGQAEKTVIPDKH